MKVFVTGATGFVGQEVVRQAHAAGHSISILARNPDSPAARQLKSHYPLETARGDVLDPTSLPGALNDNHAVVHLVGIISEVGRNTFENVHTRATQQLVATAQHTQVDRFLHLSALGTRPGAPSRYHRTKWQAEAAVRHSGLAFTIFRPSLIYGPQDNFVNLFAKIARRSPVLPVMANPVTRFQPVSVQVVAAAIVRALEEPKAIGQTFDLCGPETLTFPEILDHITAAIGRRCWKIRVPLAVARAQAAMLEFLFPRLLGKAPPLNRDQLIMLQEDNVGWPQEANELFGLKHESFREGIGRYLRRET